MRYGEELQRIKAFVFLFTGHVSLLIGMIQVEKKIMSEFESVKLFLESVRV